MSCCNRVKSSMLNTIDGNYSIWIDHSKKNTRNVPKDMTKLFFFMTTLDHMLQNKWKKFWRHLDVLPYPPYSSDIAPSYYYLFRSMQHDLFEQYISYFEDIKKLLDDWIASKELEFFYRWIYLLSEKWKKLYLSN